MFTPSTSVSTNLTVTSTTPAQGIAWFHDGGTGVYEHVSIGSGTNAIDGDVILLSHDAVPGSFGRTGVVDITLHAGRWYHLAATWNASLARYDVFLNGVQQATTNGTASTHAQLFTDADMLRIGNSFGSFFDGKIDEFATYSAPLAAEEILDIYNAGIQGACNQNECTAAPASIVGWWDGDASTVDIVANNDGTLVGDTGYAPGLVGDAFAFDGSGDYVDVATYTHDVYAFDLWFKSNTDITSTSARQGVAWFHDGGTGVYEFVSLGSGTNAIDGDVILIAHDAVSGNFGRTGVTDITLYADQWYHLAANWNAADSRYDIYLNGVKQQVTKGTASNHSRLFTNADMLHIGDAFGDSFNGLIDEFSTYDASLPEASIVAIYAAGGAGKCKFGEIQGTKFLDADGNAVQDSGEPGLANWTLYLDENNNRVLDTGEPSTRTDSAGDYSFGDLNHGDYSVREVLQPGWQQTTPGLSFAPASQLSVGGRPNDIATADFNGDGFSDLATADFSDDTVSLLFGSANGGFTTATTVNVGDHLLLLRPATWTTTAMSI